MKFILASIALISTITAAIPVDQPAKSAELERRVDCNQLLTECATSCYDPCINSSVSITFIKAQDSLYSTIRLTTRRLQ